MIQLMAVPAGLQLAVELGSAFVDGAMVKDAVTNRILAHLQPTQALSSLLLNSNPFGLAVEALNVVGGVAQNVQLWKVQQMLELVRTVSSVGAAASVLNLGVSVGGFALVLNAIGKLDGKLDQVARSLAYQHEVNQGQHAADIISLLKSAETTFELDRQVHRPRWSDTEKDANTFIHRTLHRLKLAGVDLKVPDAPDPYAAAGLVLPLLGRPDSDASALLAMLMHLSSVRAEALLCLGSPALAAEQARQQAGWLARLPGDAEATTRSLIGRDLPPRRQLEKTVQQAHALTTWVRHSQAAALERAQICDLLHQHQVDTLDYVMAVRTHPQATLLMLPYSEQARAGFCPPAPATDAVQEGSTGAADTQPPAHTDAQPAADGAGGSVGRFFRSLFGRKG